MTKIASFVLKTEKKFTKKDKNILKFFGDSPLVKTSMIFQMTIMLLKMLSEVLKIYKYLKVKNIKNMLWTY